MPQTAHHPADSEKPASPPVESTLHDAQALFEKLFESTPDANLLVNQQGVIVLANHQAEISFGYRKEELAGMPVESLVPPEERERHIQQRQRYQEAPRTRPMGAGLELWARRKNGTSFMADIILSPIQVAEGLYTLCVVRDITLKVAAQRALQEQTSLVMLVQEISTAANEAASVRDLFQYALDRVCAYLGWPTGHAWMVEKNGALVSSGIWSAQFPAQMEPVRQASLAERFYHGVGVPGTVLETRQPLWLTNISNRPNFIRREAAQAAGVKTVLAFPVTVRKEPVAILEFFSQEMVELQQNLFSVLPNIGAQLGRVIERARTEETLRSRELQLHTLISNLPVILWAIDREGRFTLFEGKGIPEIGMQPGEIVGDRAFDRLANFPDVKAGIEKALEGQEFHLEYATATGRVFDAYFSPLRDSQGAVTGALVMALDISERRRMLTELDEMRHHLMESVEIERLRLAQQLHDGPLQDLYGVFYQIQDLKNLIEADNQPAVDTPLQTIERVNETLRFICGELRPTTLVHLGLNKAITSHAERLRDRLPGLILHLNLMDDGTSLEPGVRLGLYRIYQNLMTNVIRHAQARHVWVRLELTEESAILEIQDNGAGFQVPENMIQLVREGRFGLATTLERVEAMKGTLDIQSRPGMGTLVRVTVPRR